MNRNPILRKRPGVRRGQLTSAEKEAVRDMAFQRARGMCELRIDETCQRGPLPWAGPLRLRGHLVHLRNKRMWGFSPDVVCWGCARCHLDLMHVKGLQVPRTYSDLIGRQETPPSGPTASGMGIL